MRCLTQMPQLVQQLAGSSRWKWVIATCTRRLTLAHSPVINGISLPVYDNCHLQARWFFNTLWPGLLAFNRSSNLSKCLAWKHQCRSGVTASPLFIHWLCTAYLIQWYINLRRLAMHFFWLMCALMAFSQSHMIISGDDAAINWYLWSLFTAVVLFFRWQEPHLLA